MIILLILGLTFGSSIYGIFPFETDPLSYILETMAIFTFSTILSVYVMSFIVRGGFLNKRRLLGLILFGMLIFGAAEVIGAVFSRLFNNYHILEKTCATAAGALTAFYAIIVGATSEMNTKKLLIASNIHPISIILFYYLFKMMSDLFTNLLIFLCMSAMSFLIAKQYLQYVEKAGREILGYGSIALFKALIEAMMVDRTGLLEMSLKMVATKDNANIRVLDFRGKSVLGRVVAVDVHAGPFKNIGSSNLPSIMAEKLKERNINPIIFHVPSNHERDLIFSRECDLIVKSVLSLNANNGRAIATKSKRAKRGNITVTCQAFNGIPLIVISRAPIPTEDLPYEINEICLKKVLEKGFPDGIVVDAHNAMDDHYFEFGEEDKDNLLSALDECLEELKNDPGARPLVGFASSRLEGCTIKQGFGDGGLMVMVVEVDGQKTAYIVFDGNNMVVGFREEIVEEIKREGFEVVEVATTDTHAVVGWRAKEGYLPIGKDVDKDRVLRKVVELVKEAYSKREECVIDYFRTTVRDLHFLGYEGMERLWSVTDASIKRAKKGGFMAIISIILLGIIINLIF